MSITLQFLLLLKILKILIRRGKGLPLPREDPFLSQTPFSSIDAMTIFFLNVSRKTFCQLEEKKKIFSILGPASCFYAQLPPPYVSSTTFGRLSGRGEYKWPLICVCSQSQTLTWHHQQPLEGQISQIWIKNYDNFVLIPSVKHTHRPPKKLYRYITPWVHNWVFRVSNILVHGFTNVNLRYNINPDLGGFYCDISTMAHIPESIRDIGYCKYFRKYCWPNFQLLLLVFAGWCFKWRSMNCLEVAWIGFAIE